VTEPSSIRFGIFELDLEAGELRRNGAKIRLQEQPYQILVSLLERPGKVVTRDELRKKLWPADTFVDFDHGLNAAIRRLREALDDSAETPSFVETVARRGYRFIAPVDVPRASAAEPTEQVPSVKPAPAGAATGTPSAGQPAQISSSAVLAAAKQHKWAVTAGAFALLILLSAAGFGVYSLVHRPARKPFDNLTVTQVTNTGKATQVAVSPDGRYVLSVMDDNGMQSLWLRNVPTGSDTQVIPPSAARYGRLAFSPDGNYIYFFSAQEASPFLSHLYRSPILGGTPQMIVRDAGDLTFSPDGRHIAYVRGDSPDATHWRMFTASLDGYDETLLYTGVNSEDWPVSCAWSPKGDEIFYSWGGGINVLDVRTGKSHPFVSFKDKFVAAVQWSPDGRALLANYRQASAKGSSGQIGFIRAVGGDIEPITRDANTYGSLALSKDGRTLTTIQSRSYATISVLSKVGQQFVEPRLLLSQASEFDEGSGLSWMADGNLLVSDAIRLWKLGADGKNQTQLLADSTADIYNAFPCGANYLVLSWAAHGGPIGIWRTNADGSSPLKLTDGEDEHRLPVCSPDQKWVYYVDWSENISRVPLDGSGKPEVVLRLPQNYDFDMTQTTGGLSTSSEGKTLAAAVFDASPKQTKIALFEPGSSRAPRMLDAGSFSGQSLQFTPDGKAVTYAIRENGVDNIWMQPLDGSPGHAITDFKSEQIWSFSLSPDGKSLAVLRGHWDSDVVLLQETKP
jgi:DNA-binding winged helix-turn-helix (wHTH) protein/Tol biopolymer transport system component